ncbi:unnamed protein product [Rhizophagus irregularis]|nr:unnamed protein product [Rhizophagus irregularis]
MCPFINRTKKFYFTWIVSILGTSITSVLWNFRSCVFGPPFIEEVINEDQILALSSTTSVLVLALRLNYKTCEGSEERKNQILALSSTTLALWNFRSRFFSISALRFEDPGSSSTTSVFDIQFHILVLRSQFFLRLLRRLGISVSHIVLLFCFLFFVFSLRFFYSFFFFLRKRRKEMTINA